MDPLDPVSPTTNIQSSVRSSRPPVTTDVPFQKVTVSCGDIDSCSYTENFFKGWNSIGIKTQSQPNAGDANGAFYGPISLTAKNQSRSDATDAYYRPIAGERANLHLITGQTVSKINFSREKKATSVNVGELPVRAMAARSESFASLVHSAQFHWTACYPNRKGLQRNHSSCWSASQSAGPAAVGNWSQQTALWPRYQDCCGPSGCRPEFPGPGLYVPAVDL